MPVGITDSDHREVCVTLVHGTWARLPIFKRPLWFEPGSAFRDKLVCDLRSRGVVCSFDVFLWSGANSIHRRDEAARNLADKIASNLKRKSWDAASNPGAQSRWQCYSQGFWLLIHFYIFDLTFLGENFDLKLFPIIWGTAFGLAWKYYRWIASGKNRDKNEKLIKATTSLKNDQIHGNALILRTVDDEASLALVTGTLANLLSTHLMAISTIFLSLLLVMDATASRLLPGYKGSLTQLFTMPKILSVGFGTLVIAFLLAVISRSVHGRELLYNPPGIQINVQSVPDFIHSAEIRTLLRADVGAYFALRHGLYNHPDASAAIADWIFARQV